MQSPFESSLEGGLLSSLQFYLLVPVHSNCSLHRLCSPFSVKRVWMLPMLCLALLISIFFFRGASVCFYCSSCLLSSSSKWISTRALISPNVRTCPCSIKLAVGDIILSNLLILWIARESCILETVSCSCRGWNWLRFYWRDGCPMRSFNPRHLTRGCAAGFVSRACCTSPSPGIESVSS
mgnify:CR=1 FL=1